MKKLMVLALTGLLAACSDTGRTVDAFTSEQDSMQQAVTDVDVDVVQQSFPQLFQYLKAQDSAFSEDSFLLSGENIVDREPLVPVDDEQLKPFQPYFIYNSDSSQAIDLYSHNFIVVPRNGQPSLEEGSPDAEAALIDWKAKTRRRIFFGGPSYILWDAQWVNENVFLLIGAETSDENKLIPTIWKVQDTTVEVYAYQGQVRADMEAYRAAKLHKSF